MITIVDSGGANLNSLRFALDRLGLENALSADPETIRRAPRVILPGVGAARAVMQNLRERELLACLRELKQPVLGICLGMQILFERSTEGDQECLGIIPGTVAKIPLRPGLTVPHMGWNRVRLREACALVPEAENNSYFYFVHSYAAPLGAEVQAVTDYGQELPAVVNKNNWFGVQFHPERSGLAGAKLLQQFSRIG